MNIPEADRPYIPEYGIPKSRKDLLSWSHVQERMANARNYWIATTNPDGKPHVIPVWATWADDALAFGGGAQTRWMRNLAHNSNVAVHLESGDDVIIFEGTVEQVTDADHPLFPKLNAACQAKYQMPQGVPFWLLHPRVVYAWSSFPANATRWVFDKDGT